MEIKTVVVDGELVEPQQYTRVVRGIQLHRIDQMLVHSTRNTKNPVTASAWTKRYTTGSTSAILYMYVCIYILKYIHNLHRHQ